MCATMSDNVKMARMKVYVVSNNVKMATTNFYVLSDNVKQFQNGEDESLCGKHQYQTMS